MSQWPSLPSTSSTSKPGQTRSEKNEDKADAAANLKQQHGEDHRLSHRQRVNPKLYPEDAPQLRPRWFYAVDLAKRKPEGLYKPIDPTKPAAEPKKYVSFSERDSRSIEAAFSELAEKEEQRALAEKTQENEKKTSSTRRTDSDEQTKVPVNEDFLFDVDVDHRELSPAYWLGPVYDVRRGTWFYQESNTLRPCDENLAMQLEEGYVKARPWRNEKVIPSRSSSQRRPASRTFGEEADRLSITSTGSKRVPSVDDAKNRLRDDRSSLQAPLPAPQLQTQRLFGSHMNSVVTYQDETVAWLLTDDFLSRMSSSVYQRFSSGGHLGGIKLVRGYSETKRKASVDAASEQAERGRSLTNPKTRTGKADEKAAKDEPKPSQERETESEAKRSALERHVASLVGSEDPATEEEDVRRREENEIQDDYRDADSDDQGRDIEHLILVTHGIGQRLGMKLESVNFIHDVNVLRKTLKAVYENSPDLQALNTEVEKLPKNCRIQVLPIVWRHLLDFPKQSLRQNKKEKDLSDVDAMLAEEDYPSLNDIIIEGVPAVRNLITDLALDILLFQSAYRDHIGSIVQAECNRVFQLFSRRNPHFRGKVSLIGHSLGSAIMFDVLCRQKDPPKQHTHASHIRHKKTHSRNSVTASEDSKADLNLDFPVEDFFCLGSPLGLFQMLHGRTISARRKGSEEATLDTSTDPEIHDASLLNPYGPRSRASSVSGSPQQDLLNVTASTPKCAQLYNIFHPTDPIAYRLEPLISPAMSALKPQPLPYTKRGFFGAPAQGLSGIGSRVGQSVSGFWSNITTGIASSLLNSSLGLTAGESTATSQTRAPLSMGAGTNISAGVIPSSTSMLSGQTVGSLRSSSDPADASNGNANDLDIEQPMTLLDTKIETLYSGFEKRRENDAKESTHNPEDSAEWQEADDRARRLKREEAKVRALNANGRVDFSIQE
ncbi:hypothetical protein MMC25_004494 [Agyrium rufum]|nr:hypothetical protein [Agyrium rufum]